MFLSKLNSRQNCERGQVMVLATGFLFVVVVAAAFLLDAGFFLHDRRDSQNAADAAALAGARHLPDDPTAAEDAALEWANRNGWTTGADGVNVTVTNPYDGSPNKIEVIVEGPARGVGFFDALTEVRSRAVAEVIVTESGPGDPGDGSHPSAPVPEAVPGCGGDNAVVDGRVTPGEGYESFAELVGGATVFGEAFFACDADYYYFAMLLNGPSTGGAVANENVYGCKSGKPGKKPKPGDCGPEDNPTYHTDYDTGWADTPKGTHTYKDLLNSDRARFQVSCGGTPVHDFIQDYLIQVGSTWESAASGNGEVIIAGPADSASSLEYNLEHPTETGWGDDPGENPLAQSPPFDPTYPSYAGEYDGWVWEMIYEFKLPRSAYDGCGSTIFFGLPDFPGASGPVGGIHSSPAKMEDGGSITVSSREILLVE